MTVRWGLWATVLCAILHTPALAQQFHRQGFESPETQLRLGLTNGQVELLDHSIVEDSVHSGARAEKLSVRVTSGDFALVEYAIEPTLIIEELEISAYVQATSPGVQIQARVVLPREKNPDTGEPEVTLVRGTVYDSTGRYRQLVVSRIDKLLAKQQTLLQAERKRSVDIREAYVDQVVFNIYSGVGEYDVYWDDIVVGPMVPRPQAQEENDTTPRNSTQLPLPLRGEDGQMPDARMPDVVNREGKQEAELRGEQLFVGQRPFFPRGIAHTDAPLSLLSEISFNVVFEPTPISEGTAEEAAKRNLLLVPMVPLETPDNPVMRLVSRSLMASTVDSQSLFYYVTGPLDRDKVGVLSNTVRELRRDVIPSNRLITSDVSEEFRDYSQELGNVVGTAKFPLMTSLSIDQYQRWLSQRKALAVPGTLLWSWVQTHPPREYAKMAYGHDLGEQPFDSPIGPQPEQIRLVTYSSLAAGSRGIVFTSDRWLGMSAQGRARTLAIALLNSELRLVEPFIADGHPPKRLATSHPNVEAALFPHQSGRGVLVVCYWNKPDTQYVVGQAAVDNLQLIVPGPESAQAFEISPTEVRGVKRMRDLGGIRITLREFDTVAMVVLTPDTSLYARYQQMVQQQASQAAAWQEELARLTLTETETIHARLEAEGRPQPNAANLLQEAHEELDKTKESLDREDYRQASLSAQRSMRRARMVQELHWQAARKELPGAISSPYLASYFTVPEQYRFISNVASASFSPAGPSAGDFEREGNLDAVGWAYDPHTTDAVRSSAMLVTTHPFKGERSLELRVEPENPEEPPVAMDNTRIAMVSPPVAVQPGQIARIRGALKIPKDIQASVDGVMVYDSVGGEDMALRFTKGTDWQPFELLRPVRSSGELRVHLVLTGLGTAQFDEITVELSNGSPPPIAGKVADSVK